MQINKAKCGSGTVAAGISAVGCVVGIVLYAMSAIGGYYDDFSAAILALIVLGIGTGLCCCFLKKCGNDSRWRAMQVISVAFIMFAFTALLSDRVFSIAVLLGSNLEASNKEAYARLYASLGAMAMLILAAAAQITACFLPISHKESE